jgi:putative phosphoribosyl transferase
MFVDREHAGEMLSKSLAHFQGRHPPPVVLGLPRGGVVVAAVIARSLQAPLDVLLVRKLGAPQQPELAIAALTLHDDQPHVILNHRVIEAVGVDESYLANETSVQVDEIRRRRWLYRGERPPVALAGRTVIVVDDGIATGATVRAALQLVRKAEPARLILAVPVAPAQAIDELRREVDELICLHAPWNFTAVGASYQHFDQTTDEEVIELLKSSAS